MTTSIASTVTPIFDVTQLPNRHKWTRAEVQHFYDAGVFTAEDRYELLFGELVSEPKIKPESCCARLLVEAALRPILGAGFVMRMRSPLVVSDESEPEPDIAVVQGQPRDFLVYHPTQAALIVEISDATLAFDLGAKSSLYAQAGVEDYWVIDINNRLIHVHRQPLASASLPNGYGYQTVTRLTENDQISPLAAPGNGFSVAEILP